MQKTHFLSRSILITIMIMILGAGVAAASEENSTANAKSGLDVGSVWVGRGSNSGGEDDGFIIKFEIRDSIIKTMDVDYYYSSTKECTQVGWKVPKGTFTKSGYGGFAKDYPDGLALTDGSFDIERELSKSSGGGEMRLHILGKKSKGSTFTGTFELRSPCADIVIPWEAKENSEKPQNLPQTGETEEACRARLKAKCESTMQGQSSQFLCFRAKYDIVCANTVGYKGLDVSKGDLFFDRAK
jgi:hypothetical protein